jgi:hypothetical protein
MAGKNEEFSIVIKSSEYGDVTILDLYMGRYSLAAGFQKRSGEVGKKWAYPQKHDEPAKKAIPIKVMLGSSPKEAIANLQAFIAAIQGGPPVDIPTEPAEQADIDGPIPF